MCGGAPFTMLPTGLLSINPTIYEAAVHRWNRRD